MSELKEKYSIEELEVMLDRSEMTKYILEQENLILKENISLLYTDFKSIEDQQKEIDIKRKQVEDVMYGRMYKILQKMKNFKKKK